MYSREKQTQKNDIYICILTFIPFTCIKHIQLSSNKIYNTYVQVYLAIKIQTGQYIFTIVSSIDVCRTRHSTLNPIDTRSLLLRAAWVHVIAIILASLINRYSARSDPLLNSSKARNSCYLAKDSACMLSDFKNSNKHRQNYKNYFYWILLRCVHFLWNFVLMV